MSIADARYQRRSMPLDKGARLAYGLWGSGKHLVLASHGITANHLSWQAVAASLLAISDGDASLVAIDHRGRAGSAAAPGPFGLRQHADDLAALLAHLGADTAVLAGHSMGGYVATLAAERYPDHFPSLLLVDGGLPIPFDIPDDTEIDVEAVVGAVIGPALDRLTESWPDVESYLASFAAHPAFRSSNDGLPSAAQAYVRYDAVRDAYDGRIRSSVVREAVIEDGGAAIVEPDTSTAIERISATTQLLWAPRGLMDQTPGLYPPALVASMAQALPHLQAHRVEDVNHYTILVGERGAAEVAGSLWSLLQR